MGIGSAMRSAVTAAINSIGSSVTITEYTDDTSDGGYTGDGETTVSSQSEVAIPFAEFRKLVKGKFGNLETGGCQIAIKYDADIDIATKYKVTWLSEIYDVTKIDNYTIQDIKVAYIISITKRFNQ